MVTGRSFGKDLAVVTGFFLSLPLRESDDETIPCCSSNDAESLFRKGAEEKPIEANELLSPLLSELDLARLRRSLGAMGLLGPTNAN